MAATVINASTLSSHLLPLVVLLKACDLLLFMVDAHCSIFTGFFVIPLLFLRWIQPFFATVRNAFMESFHAQALDFTRQTRLFTAAWRAGVESFIAQNQPFSIAAYKVFSKFVKTQEPDSENRAQAEAATSLLHEIMPPVNSFLIRSHACFYNMVTVFSAVIKAPLMGCIKDDADSSEINSDEISEACRDIGLVNHQTLLDGLLAALLTVSLFISKSKFAFFCAPIACWLLLGIEIIHYNAKILTDSEADQFVDQDSFKDSEADTQECDLVSDGDSIVGDGVCGDDEGSLAGLAPEFTEERNKCNEVEALAGWEWIGAEDF